MAVWSSDAACCVSAWWRAALRTRGRTFHGPSLSLPARRPNPPATAPPQEVSPASSLWLPRAVMRQAVKLMSDMSNIVFLVDQAGPSLKYWYSQTECTWMKDATLFFFVTITLMFSRIDFSTFFFGFLFFFFSLVLLLKSVTGVLREHLLNGQPFKGCHQFWFARFVFEDSPRFERWV